MEQSPSWEANKSSANQVIPRILWNRKVRYHIHNSPPPLLLLSRLNPAHAPHPTAWRPILISIYGGVFQVVTFPQVSPPIRAACPAHLILDFITYTFKKSKDWFVTTHFFFKVRCPSYITCPWDVLFSQRRSWGFKYFVLTLCRCVSGFRHFERWYYGPSKRREPLTKRHSLLSQKIWFLILQVVYT
jgi:hypothetical protein